MVRFHHPGFSFSQAFSIVPLALTFGFVLPTLLGSLWGDAIGGFIWGGLVSHLFSKSCT